MESKDEKKCSVGSKGMMDLEIVDECRVKRGAWLLCYQPTRSFGWNSR